MKKRMAGHSESKSFFYFLLRFFFFILMDTVRDRDLENYQDQKLCKNMLYEVFKSL